MRYGTKLGPRGEGAKTKKARQGDGPQGKIPFFLTKKWSHTIILLKLFTPIKNLSEQSKAFTLYEPEKSWSFAFFRKETISNVGAWTPSEQSDANRFLVFGTPVSSMHNGLPPQPTTCYFLTKLIWGRVRGGKNEITPFSKNPRKRGSVPSFSENPKKWGTNYRDTSIFQWAIK